MQKERIFTEEEIATAIELYSDGKSIKYITKILHTSQKLTRKILTDNNIKINSRAEHSRKYVCDFDFFETIDTEEKAYWLGFLYADGNVLFEYNKYGKIRNAKFVLKLKRDDESHIYKFKETINSSHPVRQLTEKIKGRIREYYASLLQINNIKFINDLVDKGCVPRKSLKLTFPEKLPSILYRHFIRGYFDGDGCVSFKIYNNQKQFSVIILGTYDFLFELKNILELNDIKCSDVKSYDSRTFRLAMYGWDNLHKLYNYFYENSNVYLDRKFYKFRETLIFLGKM